MENQIQDVYHDSTIAELCQMFGKSVNAVTVGVSRMAKDHPEWKEKVGRKTLVKAAGVEWLANYYFRTPAEVGTIDVEKLNLRKEIEKLQALLDQEKKNSEKLESTYKKLYDDRLQVELANQKQILLLEDKEKNRELEELREENERLKNRSFLERVFNK